MAVSNAVKWIGHSELSLDKEKSKRVLIYYAYPEGEKYGYFSSTTKEPWEAFLKKVNGHERRDQGKDQSNQEASA